jgi:hypothetical protein
LFILPMIYFWTGLDLFLNLFIAGMYVFYH